MNFFLACVYNEFYKEYFLINIVSFVVGACFPRTLPSSCSDDMTAAVFYYRGAAAAAGQSYSGAVLVSKDGNFPSSETIMDHVIDALRRCGIELWEMKAVTNSNCEDAPLTALLDEEE